MFWFFPTFDDAHGLPDDGWRSGQEPIRVYGALADAEAAATAPDGTRGRVLVLDPAALEVPDGTTAHVPPEAVRNVDPDGDYWRPAELAAAGGAVVRDGMRGPEALLIFRRGAWDLPKGKLDPGEGWREGGLREVAEEVGVPLDALTVTGDLGETVHGYVWPKGEAFAVKTTRWFRMATTATAFEPEAREGIEAVAWSPLAEARARVGFDTIRDVLDRLAAQLAE